MKILVPINKFDKIERLIKEGADEFYCGFVPSTLRRKHINAQSENQYYDFDSLEELKRIVGIVHRNKRKIFVVFNFPYCVDQYYPSLNLVINDLVALGIDALIVSDVGLVSFIRDSFPGFELHLSTLAGAFNRYAIEFFKDMGIRRIVLPNHLSIDEIIGLNARHQSPELEVFILNNRCSYIESFCSLHHFNNKKSSSFFSLPSLLPTKKLLNIIHILKRIPRFILKQILKPAKILSIFRPFGSVTFHLLGCKLPYRVESAIFSDGPSSINREKEIQSFFSPFYNFARASGCGVCGLYKLWKGGITHLKIEGRHNPLGKKIRELHFLRQCINTLRHAKNEKMFIESCRRQFKKSFGHECYIEQCYYPTLRGHN